MLEACLQNISFYGNVSYRRLKPINKYKIFRHLHYLNFIINRGRNSLHISSIKSFKLQTLYIYSSYYQSMTIITFLGLVNSVAGSNYQRVVWARERMQGIWQHLTLSVITGSHESFTPKGTSRGRRMVTTTFHLGQYNRYVAQRAWSGLWPLK